ncbi:hypothetical protein OROGR_016753 [Orobanche gracilis]
MSSLLKRKKDHGVCFVIYVYLDLDWVYNFERNRDD